MYAIIESCGKQYKVAQGDVVFFEKLDAKEGGKITFDKVVLVSDEGKVQIGNPYVKGVKVEGKVISHGKAKKIIVFKMKPKKNYRRREEHGSAKWGIASVLNKKYRQKPFNDNKILTQNVAIGLNGKQHRRNLNVLICGR